MFPPHIAHILLLTIAALSIALMLIRPRGIAEVWWIGGGALLIIALRLLPLRRAGDAVLKGSDVYLFLTGMMLLAELARMHGVFDWLATIAVNRANGSRARLFTLIYGVGTLVTIFMSNDATAVVLTPAVLSAVKKSKAEPLPYLFVCALIANAASFVLPISNPANLVVFRTGMPPLAHWLAVFGLPSVLSIVSTYLLLRWYFRRDLHDSIQPIDDEVKLSATGKLTLFGILSVAVVLLGASALNKDLGLPTCLAALVIAVIVSIKAKTSPVEIAKDISWGVLPLVAGLFILVEAIDSIGALRITQAALKAVQSWPHALGAFAAGFSVGIGNNLINNLPMGLIAGTTVNSAHVQGLLANAILIGADLGPNLSVTGSLATILWLIAIRRGGLQVTGWQFFKAGLLIMPLSLLLSLAALLLHPN